MADLCKLLQVHHLCVSVYHPQMDGLVKRFNQTLKHILQNVVTDGSHNWDMLISYVLFTLRENPPRQYMSTGFTPFELLFRQRPQRLLHIAKADKSFGTVTLQAIKTFGNLIILSITMYVVCTAGPSQNFLFLKMICWFVLFLIEYEFM